MDMQTEGKGVCRTAPNDFFVFRHPFRANEDADKRKDERKELACRSVEFALILVLMA
ncbi:hypothetical protein ZHAS_00013357 [Anopheles sinensis]|uniref:Uncharacterized protein n=1 Tax=Anopheles sinensis TaxID=74873 RepID=A0A084W597_ANOSI|nr:hypothetical protein ZHAS_00013357 [Anopheles sinensis]